MRPWTIPILGAVALSLALPSNAHARLRFGPAAVLGVLAAGAMFSGFRHSSRHHRHSAMHRSVGRRSVRVARIERWRAVIGAPRPAVRAPAEPTEAVPPERTAPVSPEQTAPISPERTAAIFWPDAAADLVDYVLFPKGNDRFWAHGYDSMVYAAFAASELDDPRTKRSRPAANQVSDAAPPAKAPLSSADLCGNISAAADADALIERIERAIGPSASQRDVLEQLRASLVQAMERINAACPALVPATFTERLNAIQDRIWMMHDALLTLRLPLENFYNSLTDEQQRRLRRDEPKSGESRANVTDGRAQTCAEPAAGIADEIMRAIGRAAPPSEPQRAGVEALRLNSAAMAKLLPVPAPPIRCWAPWVGSPLQRIASTSCCLR